MKTTLQPTTAPAAGKRIQGNGNGKKHTRRAVNGPRVSNGKPNDGQNAVAAAAAALSSASSDEGLDKRQLFAALTALKQGDFSVRLPADLSGLDRSVAEAFNDVVELNQKMTAELERVCRVVGKEGRISQRATIGHVSGAWAESLDSVNSLIADLVHPTSETARVIGAVAKGDLSQSMALEIEGRPLRGEFLRTAKTVNTMV